jgi:putative membrane protein
MAYLWFKSFHILGFVAWFAGLFYLPRLFVYHIEAEERQDPAKSILKEEFNRLETRLYKLIMMPAMIFTVVMAIAIISTEPYVLREPWLHIKIVLVLVLIGFHFYCGRTIRKLHDGTCTTSSIQMRRINEVPTILLGLVTLLAIFKNTLPFNATVVGTGAAIVLFGIIIQLYARKRRQAAEQSTQSGIETSTTEA